MTLLVYTSRSSVRTTGLDPDLVPGPPPRSLSVVECSDGYVLALVYPGNVGCVLSVRARRCYGRERRDDGLRARINRLMDSYMYRRQVRPEPWRRVSGFAVCPCGRTVKARGFGTEAYQYEPHDCTARRGMALGLRPVEKSDGEDWLDLRIEERRKAAELPGRRDYFRTMRNNRLTVDVHTLD